MNALRRKNGSPLRLGQAINAGGEGTIYTIKGEPRLVAKIFHQYSEERAAKLDCMLNNPPHDPMRRMGHISIAWPVELIFDAGKRCVGFLMPYIDTQHSCPLFKLYNPKDRRQTLPGFSWFYLLHTARNFASVLQALHDKGYVVGDLNESNILVTSTALVTLVDCDSVQVRSRTQVYRCRVGKAEYTPPELQGRVFSEVDRVPSHDNFGLAVLIFLLLMEGRHPFTGRWAGPEPTPTLTEHISSRRFPYGAANDLLRPPKNALFDILPFRVQSLMRRSLTWHKGRLFRKRPTANAWFKALGELERHLTRCSTNQQHIYSNHLAICPWCERVALGLPDPFPAGSFALPRLPEPHNYTRRLANLTFGWVIPFALLILEGLYWLQHRQPLDQWFAQSQELAKALILAGVFVAPFLVSLLLRFIIMRSFRIS